MARIWSTGFELNSTTAGVEFDSTSVSGGGAIAISSSTKRSGTYALRTSNAGANGISEMLFQFASSAGNGPYYLRAYLYVVDIPSAQETIMNIQDSGQTVRSRILINTDGSLELQDDTGTKFGSSSSPLSLNTWYRVELSFFNNTGSGKMECDARIDGTSFASTTISTNTGTVDRVVIGPDSGNNSYDLYWDDIAFNDSSGSFQTSWPGAGGIIHLRPNGVGDNTTWTPTAAPNWSNVNEVTPNDATNLVSDSILNDTDMYGVGYTPIKIVQSKKAVTGSTITFNSTPTAGNLVVVGVAKSTATAFKSGDVTDNKSNTYTFIKNQAGNGGTDQIALFYSANITSSATFTVTYPGAGTIVVAEYSGASTNPLDTSASTSGSSTTPNSGNITTAEADELLVGLAWSITNGDAWTAGTNFTLEQNETDNSTNERIAFEDRFGVEAGTYSAGFTVPTSSAWAAMITAFKSSTISPIISTDVINVVSVGTRFNNNTADATTQFKLQIEKTTGGTITQSVAITPNSVTWKTNATAVPKLYPITTYQDPDGASWTLSTLNTMQIGEKSTLIGINKNQVSTIWALVDYVSATSSNSSHTMMTGMGM